MNSRFPVLLVVCYQFSFCLTHSVATVDTCHKYRKVVLLTLTLVESRCSDEHYGLVACTNSTVSHPIWPSNCCTKWIQFLFLLSPCNTHLMSHIMFRFMQRDQLGLWVELLQLLCLLVQMHLFLSKANIELLT